MDIVHVETTEPSDGDQQESSIQNDESLSMIFEDLDEAVTSLMRLTKPLNDHYLLSAQLHVDQSFRSTRCANLLSELVEMHPLSPKFILDRLAQVLSVRRRELSTLLSRTQHIYVTDCDDDMFHSIYSSLKAVLHREPDKSLGSLDTTNPDGASISSLASGGLRSLSHSI
jgi:hypothetical protein